ncbi:MAG: hypothetical protein NUV82_03140, partial [Candidatus Komeilibacteria bacterium]|nr:hypothetical protein [Candidatus Komeilibacteria bacterium]
LFRSPDTSGFSGSSSHLLPQPPIKFDGDPLVKISAYNLLPNHYHLCLEQLVDKGITIFMRRLLTGYTNYFNFRYQRAGYLFSSRFKAKLLHKDEYLQWAQIYIAHNHTIHLGSGSKSWPWSSVSQPNILNSENSAKWDSETIEYVIKGSRDRKKYSKYKLEI